MYVWDPKKSISNKKKHGISFEEARDHIFEEKNMIVEGIAYEKGEVRHAVIGKYHEKYYVGIFSVENGRIRIISVRRARDEEKEQAKAKGL